jgi:hypothetical protein
MSWATAVSRSLRQYAKRDRVTALSTNSAGPECLRVSSVFRLPAAAFALALCDATLPAAGTPEKRAKLLLQTAAREKPRTVKHDNRTKNRRYPPSLRHSITATWITRSLSSARRCTTSSSFSTETSRKTTAAPRPTRPHQTPATKCRHPLRMTRPLPAMVQFSSQLLVLQHRQVALLIKPPRRGTPRH